MLNYHDYEKAIFDWLMTKHNVNPNFTFTVRQTAGKGSETDYFIGTSKSNYFSTSFWTLPVYFAGSSGDCIGLILQLSKIGYSYYFEFNQTQDPKGDQNQSALNLIKALKDPLQKEFSFKRPVQENNKMYTIQVASPEKIYGNLEIMISDINTQLDKILDLTDIAIENEKKNNSAFKAHRVTPDEFDLLLEKLNNRLEKHGATLSTIIADLGNEVTDVYFNMLKRLLNDLELDYTSEKIYFNYDKNKLIFGIGQRYVFNIEEGRFFRLISKNKTLADVEEFKTEPKAYLTNYPLDQDIDSKYDELLVAAKEILAITTKSGYYKFDKKDFRNMAFDKIDNIGLVPQKLTIKHPKNQILYGPPGTGKTYNTINKALSIIEDVDEAKLTAEDRSDILSRFNEYKEKGQIVFTTFHQSMSYEDFIEGIKPDIEEDEHGNRSIIYEVKDGIFKSIVAEANKLKIIDGSAESDITFEHAWNDLLDAVTNATGKFVLKTLTSKTMVVNEITANGNITVQPDGASQPYVVSFTRLKKLHAVFSDLSLVTNIDKEFRSVIGGMNSTAYWSVLNYINNWISKHSTLNTKKAHFAKPEPYVLIIDEINRGNVSAIFGELITLMEESKRQGGVEALEVKLPYSKEKFSVPDNVYVIGTMNTADRSVEALDTALRRRFAFTEMMPKAELLGGLDFEDINLADVLTTINNRIKLLLDADHQIGHSYLIAIESVQQLADAFNNCILPLLQEYFYHDEEKIAMILGAGFVALEHEVDNVSTSFAYFEGLDFRYPPLKKKFKIAKVDELSILPALKALLASV